mmetsp:Transcript_54849/g.101476  ORF Transcript_54849/g.101476 Transcript_54849/m.101476 type:complete len:135 (-) Transcript_54849:212-616(-)
MAGHAHNGIDYIEFTVKDMKASQAFYSKAFGWEFTDYSPTYAGIKAKQDATQDESEPPEKKPKVDKEMGGFFEGEPSPGGPLIVLYSKELEASLAAVKEAGAEIAKEIFEFPGGRRFEFKDLNGYNLAVASYNH